MVPKNDPIKPNINYNPAYANCNSNPNVAHILHLTIPACAVWYTGLDGPIGQ